MNLGYYGGRGVVHGSLCGLGLGMGIGGVYDGCVVGDYLYLFII